MIQNIWAVGRNYVEHPKELGNEVPSSPLKSGPYLASSVISFVTEQSACFL